MLIIECADCSGFEDQLTGGKEYTALEIEGGSVLVVNDQGRPRWYGLAKFVIV